MHSAIKIWLEYHPNILNCFRFWYLAKYFFILFWGLLTTMRLVARCQFSETFVHQFGFGEDACSWDHHCRYIVLGLESSLKCPFAGSNNYRWGARYPMLEVEPKWSVHIQKLQNVSNWGFYCFATHKYTFSCFQILKHVWADKTMKPRVKVFAWQLLRLALGTTGYIHRIIPNIDEKCSRCGLLKMNFQLFFECSFAKAVWFASDFGLRCTSLCWLRNPSAGCHFDET